MNTRPGRCHFVLTVKSASAFLGVGIAAAGLTLLPTGSASATGTSPLGELSSRTVASLIAPNGDRQPFGISVVPLTKGKLVAGNLLVAEFADRNGNAATGTTILQVNPHTGTTSVFYQGNPVAGPVGIAINPANDGVWVGDYGNQPNGTAANDLLILPTGKLKATYTNTTTRGAAPFIGVWGQGVSSGSGAISFYFGNAGNATTGSGGGDVWRLTPHPKGPLNGQPVNATYVEVANGQSGTPAGGDAATAAGPQGFAVAPDGTLYETNDANNTLYAIPDAVGATSPTAPRVVYHGDELQSPENVVIDPRNGDLLVVNANSNRLVEITPQGSVVGSANLGGTEAPGALFGLAVGESPGHEAVLYYGDADTNTLHEVVLGP